MTPTTDWRDSIREKIMAITQEYFGTRGTLPSDKIIELFEPIIEAERAKAVAEFAKELKGVINPRPEEIDEMDYGSKKTVGLILLVIDKCRDNFLTGQQKEGDGN